LSLGGKELLLRAEHYFGKDGSLLGLSWILLYAATCILLVRVPYEAWQSNRFGARGGGFRFVASKPDFQSFVDWCTQPPLEAYLRRSVGIHLLWKKPEEDFRQWEGNLAYIPAEPPDSCLSTSQACFGAGEQ
jgi:hypothetical protein